MEVYKKQTNKQKNHCMYSLLRTTITQSQMLVKRNEACAIFVIQIPMAEKWILALQDALSNEFFVIGPLATRTNSSWGPYSLLLNIITTNICY